jgi:hypothetical protein
MMFFFSKRLEPLPSVLDHHNQALKRSSHWPENRHSGKKRGVDYTDQFDPVEYEYAALFHRRAPSRSGV